MDDANDDDDDDADGNNNDEVWRHDVDVVDVDNIVDNRFNFGLFSAQHA